MKSKGNVTLPSLVKDKNRWSRQFVNNIEKRHQDYTRSRQEYQEGLLRASMRSVIAMRFVKCLRRKLESSGMRPSNNFKPPPKAEMYTWETQSLCSVCSAPCLSEVVTCVTCNCVSHFVCVYLESTSKLDQNYTQEDVSRSAIKFDSAARHRLEYVCFFCEDSLKHASSVFRGSKLRLKHDIHINHAKVMINRWILKHLDRIRLKRRKRSMEVLQRFMATRLARRKFLTWLRKQRRVVILSISQWPQALSNYFTTLTVVDMFNHTQLFRFDKPGSRALDEVFFIPGVSANMTIVFTLSAALDNSMTNKHTIVMQATLPLRDLDNYLISKNYVIEFSSRISWTPQVHSHSDIVFEESKTIKKDPNPEQYSCHIQYRIQSPYSSFCSFSNAPVMEFLQRSYRRNEVQRVGSRTAMWWVVVHGFNILFYHKFGDTKPKLVGDFRSAEISYPDDKNISVPLPVSVRFADGRRWTFEFSTNLDALKFLLCLQFIQNCYNGGPVDALKYEKLKSTKRQKYLKDII